MTQRTAQLERSTSESTVRVTVNLDGTGQSTISTGVGFYDHMLTALAKHSLIDMEVTTTGDLHIDGHHSIEDTAIVLGLAVRQALGDKRGIVRFGDATVPLDEALAHAVVDVAGRPAEHLAGLGSGRDEPSGAYFERDDRRLVEHDAAPARVDDGVGGAEIDC